MRDRRKHERFQLKLPARLEITSAESTEVFELQSENISAAGVLLSGTAAPFPVGIRCNLELIVSSKRIEQLTGAKGLIKLKGIVIRSTPDEVAICFNGDCQILGLKGS